MKTHFLASLLWFFHATRRYLAHRSLVRRFADGLVVFLPQKRGCGIEVGHLLPTGLHRTGAGDAVALALVHHLRGDSLDADLG